MGQNNNLFCVYDYDGYINDFIHWRKATIAKIKHL